MTAPLHVELQPLPPPSARLRRTNPSGLAPDAAFAALRPRLFAIGYRMLGTRADAEDLVQDAWLRWHDTDPAVVQSPEAWLVAVVTRLAIDRLRSAKTERAAYVGWWLPEPIVEVDDRTPEAIAEQTGELSLAFLWVLERLGAEERAAFLLREVFDYDYAEVAAYLQKSEAACRQLVHRASQRLQRQPARQAVPEPAHRRLLERFLAAARSGEREAIQALLAEQAQLVGDGGGVVPSILKIMRGRESIAKFYWAMERRYGGQFVYRFARINGEPGLLRYFDGLLESAQAFETDGDQITGIYIVRNPHKLATAPAGLQT
nr:RNA polymerase sigma-70 factor [Propionivibrio soli]